MRKKYLITKESEGYSVQEYLTKKVRLSVKQVRTLKFRDNGIMRNGRKAYAKEILSEDDLLEIEIDDISKSSVHLIPSQGELKILYEDSDVISLWKESGLVVHPAGGHYEDTLSNRLQAYFLKKQEKIVIRSIGRIDADTEGIVLFAKNQISAARLWNQLKDGRMKKEYIALCEGEFSKEEFQQEQTVDLSIGSIEDEMDSDGERDSLIQWDEKERFRYKMCISSFGKRAVTHYQALETCEKGTVVRFWLETGRTHQIRIHMAYLGHPLVGDPIYGNGKLGKDYTQLCAWKMKFFQPFTGKLIECQSDIPFLPNESAIHPE